MNKTLRMSTFIKSKLPILALIVVGSYSIQSCSKKDKDAPSNLTGFSSFQIKGYENNVFTIDQNALTISNQDSLPFQTDPTGLVAIFEAIPGSTVKVSSVTQVSGTTANDFTHEVNYLTTAADGVTTRTYKVTVNIAQQDPNTVSWKQLTNSGSWAGLQSLQAGYYKDAFYIYATLYGNSGSFKSTDGATWTTISAKDDGGSVVPTSARQTAVFGFNDKIWLLGGLTYAAWDCNNNISTSSDGNSFTVSTATSTDTRWSGRERIKSVIFKDKLWVIGGNKYPGYGNINSVGTPLNDVWNSSDGQSWTKVLDALPFTARSNAAVFVHNNKIYVAGGISGGVPLNDIWTSEDGTNWTQLNVVTPFTARSGSAGISFNGQLFLIGGRTATGYQGVSSDLWVSADDGLNWIKKEAGDVQGLPNTFTARTYPSVFIQDDALYIVGGEYQKEDGSYSQRTDVWKGYFVVEQ